MTNKLPSFSHKEDVFTDVVNKSTSRFQMFRDSFNIYSIAHIYMLTS